MKKKFIQNSLKVSFQGHITFKNIKIEETLFHIKYGIFRKRYTYTLLGIDIV